MRRKVIEVEPEPRHQRSEEASSPLELFLSATCDYAKYKCRTGSVRFKDTLMLQTRVYEVTVANRGRTQFEYNWRVIMEDSRRPFTAFVQASSPDSSPSPERTRAARKSGKANGESSVSPGRVKKDSKEAKKEAKKTGKDSQASVKQEPVAQAEPAKPAPAKPSGAKTTAGKISVIMAKTLSTA